VIKTPGLFDENSGERKRVNARFGGESQNDGRQYHYPNHARPETPQTSSLAFSLNYKRDYIINELRINK
jgi:hypothetical protein